jgi:hypothetical protein
MNIFALIISLNLWVYIIYIVFQSYFLNLCIIVNGSSCIIVIRKHEQRLLLSYPKKKKNEYRLLLNCYVKF